MAMQFATGYTATRFFTKSLAEALSNHDTSFGLLGPEIGSWYEGGGLVFLPTMREKGSYENDRGHERIEKGLL